MKKGFTLIELLVVMVIISVLISISIASITKSQKNSRDTRRKADIGIIQSALESFYNQNKTYPDTSGKKCGGTVNDWECDYTTSNPVWISGLTGVVDKIGKDPKPVDSDYPSTANGPLAASEFGVNYYGYRSVNYSSACVSPVSACPYKDICINPYAQGKYYILTAVLENNNDIETIGNSAVPKYFLNCDNMKSLTTVYNKNAYVKINAF
ncbi:MAG: type II secretion system protein [Patescibacteria group bacterium]